MDKLEMQQALKIAQDRAEAQKGATGIGFIAVSLIAYFGPDWLWTHGYGAAWTNLGLFLVYWALVVFPLWRIIDKTTVDKP